jgi:mannobiose 2-epimerase
MTNATLQSMRNELEHELTAGILPYWMERTIDHRNGGFVGFVDGHDTPRPEAPKGVVLNARILWTFSSAFGALGTSEYRVMADRAATFMRAHFVDAQHGGVYWMVNADGSPNDTRKHVYAQAFAIYAFAEHARATGDAESLRLATELFVLLERHAHDAQHGGYEEAFDREWHPLDDVRLSDADANERKSMNTHLHLVEAFTTLSAIWPEALLRRRLQELIQLFASRIVDADRGHVHAFFDACWKPKSEVVSFGHDIETSWLLSEAADALEDARLRERVALLSTALADSVLREGTDPCGGLFYERTPGRPAEDYKEWWPQAEGIVGFVAAYQATGREEFLRAAWSTWSFTRAHVVDAVNGEWHRRVSRDGRPADGHEKVGPWKCPYHNARACLEIMRRVAPAHPHASLRGQ